MLVLGVDAGGSKTVCQLADENGQVVAEARGPSAHLQTLGELEVEKVLHALIDEVLAARAERPGVICLGMAGVDRPRDAATIREILHRIGQRARLLIVNDALIALEAGLPNAPGIVVIAGTGSIAYGRNAEEQAARAGGWGYVLGDEGSGYWLGRQALRAVVRADDRRGAATALTPLLLAHFSITQPHDLVREIYEGGAKPSSIAALAVHVQTAADQGDPIALQILDVASAELAAAASSVARRLALPAPSLVLAGGTFKAAPRLAEGLVARLSAESPGLTARPLDVEPAHGAVRLARRLAAGDRAVPAYIDSYA